MLAVKKTTFFRPGCKGHPARPTHLGDAVVHAGLAVVTAGLGLGAGLCVLGPPLLQGLQHVPGNRGARRLGRSR